VLTEILSNTAKPEGYCLCHIKTLTVIGTLQGYIIPMRRVVVVGVGSVIDTIT